MPLVWPRILRLGAIKTRVLKKGGPYKALRKLARTYRMVVRDVVRTKNRIRSMYRSRGVAVAGKSGYSSAGREPSQEQLPEACRGPVRTLYAELDALEEVRNDAKCGEGIGAKSLQVLHHQIALDLSRPGSDSCGPVGSHRGQPTSFPHQAPVLVLVVLWSGHRHALVVGLGTRQVRAVAARPGTADPRTQPDPQRQRFDGEHPLNDLTRESSRSSKYRLCPLGVPNEAMAPGGPYRRWFPHFAREQDGFRVDGTTDIVTPAPRTLCQRTCGSCHTPLSGDRRTDGLFSTTSIKSRTRVDAGCQNHCIDRRSVIVCLDVEGRPCQRELGCPRGLLDP
jgi:hypothetical protein